LGLSFNQLEQAYQKTYQNAKELIEESEILYEHKRYARAYTLAQIAHEEIAKLPIIFQETTKLYYGEGNDWKKFNNRLRNHHSKNKLNLAMFNLFEYGFKESIQGKGSENMQETLKFKNEQKNMSLYAENVNNNYKKPSEIFDQQKAQSLT
jgi:AbiV family abortive infection protein